jgi:hypothetical protein
MTRKLSRQSLQASFWKRCTPMARREKNYTRWGSEPLFGAMRFLWNATRGHRLTPWRSEFLRWRVETYSGKPAESLSARDVFGFMWEQKWELWNFLFWTGDLEREARRRP